MEQQMTNKNDSETEFTEIKDHPSKIYEIIKKAKKGRFFVKGDTPLHIKNTDSYLPLCGHVKVTRASMLQYINNICKSSDRRKEKYNQDIQIELSFSGSCYFI